MVKNMPLSGTKFKCPHNKLREDRVILFFGAADSKVKDISALGTHSKKNYGIIWEFFLFPKVNVKILPKC